MRDAPQTGSIALADKNDGEGKVETKRKVEGVCGGRGGGERRSAPDANAIKAKLRGEGGEGVGGLISITGWVNGTVSRSINQSPLMPID